MRATPGLVEYRRIVKQLEGEDSEVASQVLAAIDELRESPFVHDGIAVHRTKGPVQRNWPGSLIAELPYGYKLTYQVEPYEVVRANGDREELEALVIRSLLRVVI